MASRGFATIRELVPRDARARRAWGAIAVALLVVTTWRAVPANAQIDFDAPRAAYIGQETAQFDVGDFDEDGRADVLAVCARGLRLTLSREDRTFRVPRTVLSSPALEVHVADFDGDSHLDFVVDHYDRLVVGLGDGDGRFPVRTEIHVDDSDTWWGVATIQVADVDGNGSLDVVRLHDDVLFVFLGDGTGTGFSDPVETSVGRRAFGLALGDLNRDGLADAVARTPAGLQVLLGERDGRLNAHTFLRGRFDHNLVVGDWDGDGCNDIASGADDGPVRICFGDGSGDFPRRVELPLEPGEWLASIASVANRSRVRDDLLLGVQVQPQTGAAVRLEVAETRRLRRVERADLAAIPSWLRAADVDGDGDQDWIMAHNTPVVTVWEREGDRAASRPAVEVRTDDWVATPAAFDIDGDGDRDILTADGRALRNDGPIGFTETDYLRDRYPEFIRSFVGGDFTGDGEDDLLMLIDEGRIAVLTRPRPGEPAAAIQSSILSSVIPAFTADVDGDGNADLVGEQVAHRGIVLFGSGDGRFEHFAGLSSFDPGAAGDFDGDAIDDVLGNALHLTAGDASRHLIRRREVDLGDVRNRGYDAGDLNGDGIADLVYFERDSASLHVALSANGRGMQIRRSLGRGFPELGFAGFGAVHLRDLDRDGRLDLVLSMEPIFGNLGVLVLPGRGNGRFRHASAWSIEPLRDGPGETTTLVDFDDDGDLDILQSDGYVIRITTNRSGESNRVRPQR